MLNEGVYRSPKWLRKFVDFEVNTGDDISSKKSLNELEKATTQEFLSRFQKIDWDKFRTFYNNSKMSPAPFMKRFSDFNKYLLSYEKDKLIQFYLNIKGEDKLLILNQYDRWLKERVTKEQLVNKIMRLMKEDFKKYPYTGLLCCDSIMV